MGKSHWVAIIVAGAISILIAAQVRAEATTAPSNWNPPAISAGRALQLFEAVCGGSLPKFAKSKKLMAANGINLASPNGTPTIYSAAENVSFQIQTYSTGDGRCSMVFKTNESRKALRRAFKSLGSTKIVMGNLSANYQGRTVAVLEEGEDGFNRFFMLSEVEP